jgi:hypothetical protein
MEPKDVVELLLKLSDFELHLPFLYDYIEDDDNFFSLVYLMSQELMSQERTSQERTSQERTSQELMSQERTSQERTSQERTSQERTSQERTSQEKMQDLKDHLVSYKRDGRLNIDINFQKQHSFSYLLTSLQITFTTKNQELIFEQNRTFNSPFIENMKLSYAYCFKAVSLLITGELNKEIINIRKKKYEDVEKSWNDIKNKVPFKIYNEKFDEHYSEIKTENDKVIQKIQCTEDEGYVVNVKSYDTYFNFFIKNDFLHISCSTDKYNVDSYGKLVSNPISLTNNIKISLNSYNKKQISREFMKCYDYLMSNP